ncbi:MAG: M28 family peptidase [Deltaproteobacteria bacterium]|nr:M28 family peptidase [Deltaproteobacteria bacterium]
MECDHAPFKRAGIPSALLIDLDYPEWHTRADVPAACEATSLAQMARFVEAFVFGAQ